MGAVYKAHDSQLDRLIAIKIPKFDAADTALLERFYREARAAATLSHPNICPVFDVGEIDGTHYISMGYIEGKPLSAFIRPDKPLSEKQAVMIIRKLAVALNEAHGKGIVHRDLKPDNVMIDQRSNPVIMDFGLARRSTGADDIRVTQGGQMLGTPAYMSPEQVEGDVDLMGPRSDIYSLGVMLYEMLTGRLPYEGSIASVLAQIIKGQPKQPVQFRDKLNPELQVICLKMMASELGDRYASMAEVARDLGAFIKGKPTSVRDSMAGVTSPGMATQDEGLSQLIAVDDVPVSARTSRKSRVRSSQAQSSPASKGRLPSWTVWSGAAAAGIAILLAGYTLFVKVGDQTVRIQIDDPDAQLFVDGDEVRIENLGATIELKPGEHGMEIRRGDIVVQADTFTVLKGDNPVLKLTVLAAKQPDIAVTPVPPTVPESLATPPARVANSSTTPPLDIPEALAESDDPVRRAVGWALSRNAFVTCRIGDQSVRLANFDDVPAGDFTVSQLHFGPVSEIPESEWGHLRAFASDLEVLFVHCAAFDNSALAHLAAAPKLTRVHFSQSSMTDAGYSHLASMPALRHVNLGGTGAADTQQLGEAGLRFLAAIPRLNELFVENLDLSGGRMRAVAAMKNLTMLAFVNCNISDDDVEHLRDLKLQQLRLPGNPITDASAQVIGGIKSLGLLLLKQTPVGDDTCRLISSLPRLRNLDLGETKVSDAGMEDLAKLVDLEYLQLNGTGISDAGLKKLESARILHLLTVDSTNCTEAGVTAFRKAAPNCKVSFKVLATSGSTSVPAPTGNPAVSTALVPPEFSNSDDPVRRAVGWAVSRNFSLNLVRDGGSQPVRTYDDVPDGPLQVGSLIIAKDRPIESEDWHHLKALRGLNSLVVRDGKFDDAALAHLADSPNLKILQLLDTSVTDEGLQRLTTMPALEELLLGTQSPERRATKITDEVLTYISQIPKLRKLNLNSCAITDDGLETLSNLDGLRELSLRHCRLTDSGIEHLSDLNLQTLHLQGNTITDASAQVISEIKTLESLTLRGTEAGDKMFRQLCSLPRLQLLDMEGTNVTDAGLDEVSKLRRLQTLVLSRTAITDAGLKKLHELRGLRTLSLQATHCTSDGVNQFRSVNDNCKVSYTKSGDSLVNATPATRNPTPSSTTPGLTKPVTTSEIQTFLINNKDPELKALHYLLSRGLSAQLGYKRAGSGGVKFIQSFDDMDTELFQGTFHVQQVGVTRKTAIGPGEWKFLESLPHLKSANLMHPSFDDTSLAFLAGHPTLNLLQLENPKLTDAGAAQLATIPNLETVTIGYAVDASNPVLLTDAAVGHLVRLPRLLKLGINRSEITDAGLSQLVTAKPGLQLLGLAHSKITDKGTGNLRHVPRLVHLTLSDTGVGDGLAEVLPLMSRLSGLTLARTSITDKTMQGISQLAKLRTLNVTGTAVTDAGVAHIKGMPSLEYLTLDETEVTDACLTSLAEIASLKSVNLYRGNVTAVAVQRLRAARPELRVSHESR
jgi:serine/threonine protein kinase/Leucine-rich repeat (LRR) protein